MAQNQDLRKQSSVPTTPSDTDKVVLYANASGQLNVVNSNGTVIPVGGAFTANLSQAGGTAVTTGLARLNVTATTWASGAAYGTTGTNALGLTEFLGKPAAWYKIVGSSGENYMIPAYSYV